MAATTTGAGAMTGIEMIATPVTAMIAPMIAGVAARMTAMSHRFEADALAREVGGLLSPAEHIAARGCRIGTPALAFRSHHPVQSAVIVLRFAAGGVSVNRNERSQSRALSAGSCETDDDIVALMSRKYFPLTPSTAGEVAR